MNKELMRAMFPKQISNIEQCKCATCGKDMLHLDNFRDDISRKEFKISGMCQECQDKTFGE